MGLELCLDLYGACVYLWPFAGFSVFHLWLAMRTHYVCLCLMFCWPLACNGAVLCSTCGVWLEAGDGPLLCVCGVGINRSIEAKCLCLGLM